MSVLYPVFVSGNLYLISSPIGNPKDISVRAKECLEQLTVLACEDTRVIGRFLKTWGIGEQKKLISYYEHNERKQVPYILNFLKSGEDVGLVVCAGTPLISDPGYVLVREAIAEGISVKMIPGPCACISALLISGLPPDKFLFLGFPPRKEGEQRRFFEKFLGLGITLIFYESPRRLYKTLFRLQVLLKNHKIVICRELTKTYEEVIRGQVGDILLKLKDQKIRGEITVVLGLSK